MKIQVIVSLCFFLFGSSYGQSISCYYSEIKKDNITIYSCGLIIENPHGFNDFTEIPGEHMRGRSDQDVTHLVKGAGPSETTNFPNIICSQFQNLEFIYLPYTGIKGIHEDAFSGCSALKDLFLDGNFIKDIPPLAFANNKQLNKLHLSENSFETLPENVFAALTELQSLDLSFNPLSSIHSKLFTNLRNLKRLDIQGNEIEQVNPEWFTNLENLEQLSLYQNRLITIPTEALSELKNLKMLKLDKNSITDLPVDIFDALTKLENLNLANNDITELNPQWFQSLSSLTDLDLADNILKVIPENLFDNLTSLKRLYISSNYLTESNIPGNLFDNLENLKILHMHHNLLESLNPKWFAKLTSLESLNLLHNQINELPNGVFASSPNLVEIILIDNNLMTINRNSFGNLEKLNYIHVGNNKINAIDKQFLDQSSNLVQLSVENNNCINTVFFDFQAYREKYLKELSACTENFKNNIDIETEAGAPFQFFEAPQTQGIQFRVRGSENIQIALGSTNAVENPMLHIEIDLEDNTRLSIIRNQEERVFNKMTGNTLEAERWNDFLITWADDLALVFIGQSQSFGYYISEPFDVTHFGLRTPDSNAEWIVQPVTLNNRPWKK